MEQNYPSFAPPVSVWQPVPIPMDWPKIDARGKIVPGEAYSPNYEVLSQATPKYERKRHPKGFEYTTGAFAQKQLNRLAGYGRWTWVETRRWPGRAYKQAVGKDAKVKEYIEVCVEGWVLVPGFPPAKGIGSAPWSQDDVGDPRFSEVTAYKAATSMAIKDAAKRGFGIGADVGDEEGEAVINSLQQTCKSLFDTLVANGKKDKALRSVRKFTPTALLEDELIPEMIDEMAVENLMGELSALVISM